jgi:hypothetical protein
MNATLETSRSAACWIKTGLPWVIVFAISAGVALAMNAAAARALPEHRPSDAVSNDTQEVVNLCALHVDGPVYAFVPAPEARNFYDRVCTSGH